MPEELGFEEQNQRSSPSGFGTRDFSPDSVVFSTAEESNFSSLFSSSASGSVDRRSSFTSDLHDRDSLVSEEHLAGFDPRETPSGPDSDPKKSTVHRNSCSSRKVQKAKVHIEEGNTVIGDRNETLDSGRNSFSQALKECQDRSSRSEFLLKNPDRRIPVSLDLNNHITNATSSSPRFGVLKKSSVMNQQTGMSPSPGVPNYRHASVGIQKGWSSERVPSHNNANRRHLGAALLPFNSGRTVPSKWEDAERWIFSPVSGDGVMKPSFQLPQTRLKSKSGPLGPVGIANYASHSPAVSVSEGVNVGNLTAGSPFSAVVNAADDFPLCAGVGGGVAGIFATCMKPCMARSVSVHGCSELLIQSSLCCTEGADEILDGDKDATNKITHSASRRDVATQMSPVGSPHSSSGSPSFSPSTPSDLPIIELGSVQSSKLEVRDVQVDRRVTVTRWSKKHRTQFPGKGSEKVDDWKKKALEVRSSAWEVSETAKSVSKMQKEEAKITAWENLQKAKADAAMRKLEVKLEKRRSSSMDKIMNKLRSAQKKAQEMRSSVSTDQSHQVTRTSNKVISLHRARQISSLSGCFTCHAF